jgi:WD40 repeat protein/tRNA A-37 threonylcarbamoyl transferase component Bud32
MICCLNPACHNPSCPDGTKFCFKCGTQLVDLRRYHPIRQLGSGGFGKTYLAEDVDSFNEQCVIKQFAPQSQGTSAFEIATRLFEEEARRLKQLGQHSQIPSLLAYFKQDNRLYLVQQYIEGLNLLDELELHGAFSEQKIRELLLDLLNILKTVHQEKVIHRDLKPENIIRRQIDNKLVLIDFGASKQLSGTILTKQGTTIGSFGYAPLEQMDGGEAYPASDLYSLGATCFHLLSGINPWELWKRKGYSWINNWRQNLGQSVSLDLGCVLDKLLQEDYQKRYQSTEEVLQDLNRKSSPKSPSVTPPPHQPLPQKIVSNNPLLLELIGHSEIVKSVAISPDGEMIVSGSNDKTIKIWNLKTGLLINTLTEHFDMVYSIAISPDGQTLVSGSYDKTIKIWNLKTGVLKTTLTGHISLVYSVAISSDGQTLVSGSNDKTIKIRNLETGKLKTTLTGHSNWVNSVTISPDGQTLVSGSNDKTIKIWNLQNDYNINNFTFFPLFLEDKLKTTLTGHTDRVNSVAISPDGQTLVSGSNDKTIKIWNLKTGALKTTLAGHSNWVNSVAISPNGQILVSGSCDDTIKIWNLKTGALKTTLAGHSQSVNSVAISPDGETIVSGSRDNTIKVWRMPK